ncbi:MAG: penicillin-binding protein 2 [Gammaproteobacteria bacterium]|nr:penicillin-binding protein 2 [Gammaproteobacteria bacterium]
MRRRVTLLKNPSRERQLFQVRAIIALLLTLLLLLILLGRLFYLQRLQHDHYITLSTNNRVSVQPLAPTRGLIYDRNGVILAQNIPTYSLELVRERVEEMEWTLEEIGKLIQVEEDDLNRFRRELQRRRRFEAVPLRFRLDDKEVALIAVNLHRLPGVEINSSLTRHYPQGELTAHTVGYVGRINENELTSLDPTNYAATHYVGKIGVERSYEGLLHGEIGHQQVETNARGRVQRILERTPPRPGKNLYLNIDTALQRVAHQAFGEERGALVAIEPQSGAILSLVSVPGYDPNIFVNGVPLSTYEKLSTDRDQPLFNRALRGQYPPGSTIKPFIGLAGLELNQITTLDSVSCKGWFSLKNDDHRYRDWKKIGHGEIGLTRAIVESCDVFFYELSLKLGIDQISTFLAQFGFGAKTGSDLGGEASGLLPSREWKRRVRKEPWFPGETLITSIGQGFNLATPLQLGSATATLALRGRHMRPLVVREIEEPGSEQRTPLPPTLLAQLPVVDEGNWWRIERAMAKVVHDPNGTARGISHGLGYQMAGKTGTSQVFTLGQDAEYEAEELAKRLRDHALFIAFAPVDKPRIAVALIVENGGSGGAVAAPIARQVIDRYLQDNPVTEERKTDVAK